jgi:hypothetical protein
MIAGRDAGEPGLMRTDPRSEGGIAGSSLFLVCHSILSPNSRPAIDANLYLALLVKEEGQSIEREMDKLLSW